MNKKEVLEIRKQFSPKNCAITKICGCYVDYEKNKKMESKEAFLALPEEEAFKYFDIFKKTLSGSLGKNLLNMEFPLDQEMPGGTQEFLLKLKNSKLEDDVLALLNNLNIRHNNCMEGDKNYKEIVAKMSKDELENWYDETYQLCLLAFLELDNVERTKKVSELKASFGK